MPILSGNLGELADELREFEREQKASVSKIITAQADFDKKHQQVIDRLNTIEEKARQLPAERIEGGQLAEELMRNRALIDRPKDLGRGQSFQITISTKAAVSGISRTIPYVTGVVAPGPAPAVRLRSVIPSVSISQGSVLYTRETGFTNSAAPVAELAAKPESTLTYANVNAPVETIAHWTAVSKQCYEDLPALAAAIEDRLIAGLLLKEEAQLLTGDGVSPNLTGYMTVATAHAAFPVGTSLFDCLALTVGEQTAAGYPPTACVVNAIDWTTQALAKTATEKQYLAVPGDLLPRVITSPSMAAGSFLVGNFNQSTLFQREDATIQVAFQHVDNFTKNTVTILAELRVVLAIFQAAAFVKGTIPSPTI